ncbi:hypothetical protein NEOLEDRAFT_1154663 [Neolentinus lepideus HHB14362 ss-1]|uniref:RNase H type-1 domain-containing protein n=1 Tax=Neolentinus lepideus HHB14362 ss-1 TaxID=1314782 RepID=A0A165UE89_9AGAM|nr:hypothetical protein NEOLEDRAFT_1154663 [Neolentinus lepideus HHB14362 ss-1]
MTDGLAHGFRIFTDPSASCNDPALRTLGRVIQEDAVTAWTDGSCLGNGSENARVDSGVFFGPDDPRNISARLSHTFITNNDGEIAAVLLLVQAVDSFVPLHFKTDSKLIVNALAGDYREWEEQGYIGVSYSQLWRPLIARLQA